MDRQFGPVAGPVTTRDDLQGAEYLYYNLGNKTLSAVPNLAASNFFGPSVFSSTKVDFDGSVIRARLSYLF